MLSVISSMFRGFDCPVLAEKDFNGHLKQSERAVHAVGG